MVVLYISQLHIPIQSHFRFSAGGVGGSNHIMVKDQLMAERACSRFFLMHCAVTHLFNSDPRSETTCASAKVHGPDGGSASDAPTSLRLRCGSRKTGSRLQSIYTACHVSDAVFVL